MARLRTDIADDGNSIAVPSRPRKQSHSDTTTSTNMKPADTNKSAEPSDLPTRLVPKTPATTKARGTQIRLIPIQNTNNLVNSPTKAFSKNDEIMPTRDEKILRSPIISERSGLDFSRSTFRNDKFSSKLWQQREVQVDFDESIWCDSTDGIESSSEAASPNLRKKSPQKRPYTSNGPSSMLHPDLTKQLEALSLKFDNSMNISMMNPTERSSAMLQTNSRPVSSSDKENDPFISSLSPSHKQASELDPEERPETPPEQFSPTKARLKSPSKTAARVPTPPHRQSLDAFWTADTVNDWNDQYSPQKPLKSPRKLFFQIESEDASPTASPRKLQSPSKRTKAELDARKDFEARKIALAESFLQELDQQVTNGQIKQLAESTGGVKLVWSKTLNSTAGRANWRRETTKSKNASSETTSTHKHFASIELATKVIDCENRLLNVIAHEFCHLANFMVSGIKDQPHGKQFKEWGRLCTRAFGDRGVEVTTKHSYEIEYKYIWQCTSEECAMEFKRHSKSIDPTRHRCGSCKSSLAQIKPVPRRAAKNVDDGSETPTLGVSDGSKPTPVIGYAAYVKEHFAPLKKSMPGATHKAIMEALGKQYRAEKTATPLEQPDLSSLADTLAKDMDRITLGDSDDPVEATPSSG